MAKYIGKYKGKVGTTHGDLYDGKIGYYVEYYSLYVGGDFTTPKNRLIRLNSYGSENSTFDMGTGFNGRVESIVLDSTGKVYCGGDFAGYDRRIIRLNPNGSKDTTFNIGTGFNNIVHSIVLDPDGKLYCGGAFTTYKGEAVNRIIRLNPDGTRDTTFNSTINFDNTINTITLGF